MGSRQTELPRGCFIESVARRDGGRKAKGSKFIGSEKLFRQIDQNEFLVLFSGLIRERKRGKCFQLSSSLGTLIERPGRACRRSIRLNRATSIQYSPNKASSDSPARIVRQSHSTMASLG